MSDSVNHPSHYTSHESGVECITVTERMCFLLGNAIKYIWRSPFKGKQLEDLRKAKWYIERKIELIERDECRAQNERLFTSALREMPQQPGRQQPVEMPPLRDKVGGRANGEARAGVDVSGHSVKALQYEDGGKL